MNVPSYGRDTDTAMKGWINWYYVYLSPCVGFPAGARYYILPEKYKKVYSDDTGTYLVKKCNSDMARNFFRVYTSNSSITFSLGLGKASVGKGKGKLGKAAAVNEGPSFSLRKSGVIIEDNLRDEDSDTIIDKIQNTYSGDAMTQKDQNLADYLNKHIPIGYKPPKKLARYYQISYPSKTLLRHTRRDDLFIARLTYSVIIYSHIHPDTPFDDILFG